MVDLEEDLDLEDLRQLILIKVQEIPHQQLHLKETLVEQLVEIQVLILTVAAAVAQQRLEQMEVAQV
jgi:hypothetical protein